MTGFRTFTAIALITIVTGCDVEQDIGDMTQIMQLGRQVGPCQFEYQTPTGPVIMNSRFHVSLSNNSPTGTGFTHGVNELGRFNLTADACGDMELIEFDVVMHTYDGRPLDYILDVARDMSLDVFNLSTDGLTTPAFEPWAVSVKVDHTAMGSRVDAGSPEVVPAGVAYTYAIYEDTTGMTDPCVEMRIRRNSVTISDGTTTAQINHPTFHFRDICF